MPDKCLHSRFVLDDLAEEEYREERDRLRGQLTALSPPVMPDLEKAAVVLTDFGAIWKAAKPKERKQMVHTLLQTVYLDGGEQGPVLAIEPKPEFATLFDLAK